MYGFASTSSSINANVSRRSAISALSTGSSFPAVSKVLITGSADGLGRMAARRLVDDGHDVVVHARRPPARGRRAAGDAGAARGARGGPVEHRADAGGRRSGERGRTVRRRHPQRRPSASASARIETVDGLAHVFAINVLAPYLLTALIDGAGPARVPELGHAPRGRSRTSRTCSGRAGDGTARRPTRTPSCSTSCSRSRSPGAGRACSRTRSSRAGSRPRWAGRALPTTSSLGADTQAWLATSDDPDATVTGRYFYHRRARASHPAAASVELQDGLLERVRGADRGGVPDG